MKYLDLIFAKRNTAIDIRNEFQEYVDSLKIKRSTNAIKIISFIGFERNLAFDFLFNLYLTL